MEAWTGCRMLTFYKIANYDEDPCDVVMDENKITISYKEKGKELCRWNGIKVEGNLFILENNEGNGKDHLFYSEQYNLLEGSWQEKKRMGMWKVELEDRNKTREL